MSPSCGSDLARRGVSDGQLGCMMTGGAVTSGSEERCAVSGNTTRPDARVASMSMASPAAPPRRCALGCSSGAAIPMTAAPARFSALMMRANKAGSRGPAPKRISVSAFRVAYTTAGLTGIGERVRSHVSYRLPSTAATVAGMRRAALQTMTVPARATRHAIPAVDRKKCLNKGGG